jgi:hypothetical protein
MSKFRNPKSKSEIARENGRKSKGPITPAGKAKSSMNALRHGHTSHRAVLLTSESEQDLRAFSEIYFDRYLPHDAAEALLVEEVIACAWRLRRLWHSETALFDIELARLKTLPCPFEPIDDTLRTALAYQSLSGSPATSAPAEALAHASADLPSGSGHQGGQLLLLQRYARSLRFQQGRAQQELERLQAARTRGDRDSDDDNNGNQPNEPTESHDSQQPPPPQPHTAPTAPAAQRRNLTYHPQPKPQPATTQHATM